MSITPRYFQARLAAKLDTIAQKLTDNSISLTGTITDVIRIASKRSIQGDLLSRTVDDIGLIEIIFPKLTDVPMWRFVTGGHSKLSQPLQSEEHLKMFECLVPISSHVDQDDIIVRFFENPAGDDPLVLVLQAKEILGTFGNRSIIYTKVRFTFFDEELPTQIKEWCLDMARRRLTLTW